MATANAEAAVHSPDAIRRAVADYAAIGMTELTFAPTWPDLAEIDRLADLGL